MIFDKAFLVTYYQFWSGWTYNNNMIFKQLQQGWKGRQEDFNRDNYDYTEVVQQVDDIQIKKNIKLKLKE